MNANSNDDDSTDLLLTEIQKTVRGAHIGFPPPEEMHRLRTKFQAAKVESWNRMAREEEDRMQRLKERVRAVLRKDRP